MIDRTLPASLPASVASAAPAAVFRRLSRKRGAFWLDDATAARASFMSFGPVAQLQILPHGLVRHVDASGASTRRYEPLLAIEEFASTLRDHADSDVPWIVGFLSYDLAPLVEPRMALHRAAESAESQVPLAYLARYDAVLRLGDSASPPRLHARSEGAADALVAEIARTMEGDDAPPLTSAGQLIEAPERAPYVHAIERALEYISAGDIYQVNLAGRFRARAGVAPADAYLRMRALQPVPMGFFLDCGDFAVLANTPERYLRVHSDRIATEPIKGTRARLATSPEQTRVEVEALAANSKEQAEHIMIVDLERNDLGRICRPGSVEVSSLMRVESFATLHHLVSTVRGHLRSDVGLADVFRATFPGGSITGAPKIRATQVIAELEAQRRGLYTGALVWLSGARSFDSAIAIRTAVARQGTYTYYAGGGIVADSVPLREYEECWLKAEPFLGALLGNEERGDRSDRGPRWRSRLHGAS